jgi:hypothetical protein
MKERRVENRQENAKILRIDGFQFCRLADDKNGRRNGFWEVKRIK